MSSAESPATPACRIYGIRQCDTMKKALAWLDQQAQAYAFVDYKCAGVVAERAPVWFAQVGWEALLNRRGLTWRRLPESARTDLDERAALALMIAHPTLIRRPVLEIGERVLVGFDPQVWTGVLAS
jgi:arsenate reductase (glutaredoxin)